MSRALWLFRSIGLRFGDDMLRLSSLLSRADRELRFYGITIGQLCIGLCWSRKRLAALRQPAPAKEEAK